MQIVIDIPEEVKNKVYAHGLSLCPSDKEQLIHAIMNGVPLPKGHGRLIDADALNRKDVNCANVPMNFIDNAPTIIEAESEE